MTALAPATTSAVDPHDVLNLSALLSPEESLVRETVRRFVQDRVLPDVGDWFERGVFPPELIQELGELGVLGMHLDGYGCAGTSAVNYGLACLELEAGDSGLRSFVSVQGSLAMYAIWKYGSEDQKQEWLPRMAAGRAVGCFGLTEPDFGSNPSGMATRACRDGDDWVLNGTKMWITSGSIADVAVVWARADEGIRGFLVPKGTAGFSTRKIEKKLSLRASVTSELFLQDCRLPADAVLPEARGLAGPSAASTKRATGSSGALWGLRAAATKPHSRTRRAAFSLTSPLPGSSSRRRSSSTWRSSFKKLSSWRCTLGGRRTQERSCPSG